MPNESGASLNESSAIIHRLENDSPNRRQTTRDKFANFRRHLPFVRADEQPEEAPRKATLLQLVAAVFLVATVAFSDKFGFWYLMLGVTVSIVLQIVSMTYWRICCEAAATELRSRYKDGFRNGREWDRGMKSRFENMSNELGLYKEYFGKLPDDAYDTVSDDDEEYDDD